jgi:hypothetical protein
MTNDKDSKRAAYEASLSGIVEAMHGLVVAFETAAIARRAYDPDNTMSDVDPAQHGAITSCCALMASILMRNPGAAQMLGLDRLATPPTLLPDIAPKGN